MASRPPALRPALVYILAHQLLRMAACSTHFKTACILCLLFLGLSLLVGCGFLASTTFLAAGSTRTKAAGLLQEIFAAVGLPHDQVSEDQKLSQVDTNIGGIPQQSMNPVAGGVQRRWKLSRMMGSVEPSKAQHHIALAKARSRGCAFNASVCKDSAYLPTGSATCCGGACVDVLRDSKNCGLCNAPCVLLQVCCNGECTDTNTDPQNCGECGKICSDGICLLGVCGYY